MPQTSITYIVSDINKALAFEWIAEELNTQKFGLSFILLNRGSSVLEEWLQSKQIPVYRVQYQGKKDLVRAIWEVYGLLKKHKVQIVHCHLFDACLIGLTAARLAGISKRIFTRHYSTFHHEYFPRAVWYDKYINWMATDIVAISENVQAVLLKKEKVNPEKVHLIHHGFRLEDFSGVSLTRVDGLRKKYNLADKGPVVGVISRYFELKGIQYIIPAFQKLLLEYPRACLLLANATGNYTREIHTLLEQLPRQSYIEIRFEEDLFALYQLFDVFVHVPINPDIEAFGQIYVEALAAGVPAVYTLSGVATEFIEHDHNALVVAYQNAEQIQEAMARIVRDKDLASRLSSVGKQDVMNRFTLSQYIHKLEELYTRT